MPTMIRHLEVLRGAMDHARSAGSWVVIVAPQAEDMASTLAKVLVGIRPRDSQAAGSTVLFPGGGRVTVVRSTHQVQGEGYFTVFYGFETAPLPSDEIALHSWRARSKGTLTFCSSAFGSMREI